MFGSIVLALRTFNSTGPAAQVNMMGYAKPEQTTAGIHQRLWARAFLFSRQHQDNAVPIFAQSPSWWMWRSRLRATASFQKYSLDPLQTICFVSIDTGMGSDLLNTRVLERLDELLPGESPCTVENLSISGTHTHRCVCISVCKSSSL
jgi:neutral ceramidase